jgi:hypothetical protein
MAKKFKDDLEYRNYFDQVRLELLTLGFAIIKEMAERLGKTSGNLPCPLCLGSVRFSVAASNGHCHACCETPGCIKISE